MTGVGVLVSLSLTLAASSPTVAQAPRGTPAVWFLGISPALPPGDLLSFRQALAHGIDRAAVARAAAPHAVLQGTTQPAGTIEHPTLPGYNPAVRGQPYDPARSKELFAQSGWTRPISILTTSSTNNWVLSIERALVESLQASTGVTVSFAKVASFAVLTSSARAGTVPIWLYGWESRGPSMPMGLARAYFMSDPDVRTLVERSAAVELEQLLLDRAFVIPIVFYLAP